MVYWRSLLIIFTECWRDEFHRQGVFLGNMVKRLLAVYTKEDKPTDRDNFQFKRVETAGILLYDLFREFF